MRATDIALDNKAKDSGNSSHLYLSWSAIPLSGSVRQIRVLSGLKQSIHIGKTQGIIV